MPNKNNRESRKLSASRQRKSGKVLLSDGRVESPIETVSRVGLPRSVVECTMADHHSLRRSIGGGSLIRQKRDLMTRSGFGSAVRYCELIIVISEFLHVGFLKGNSMGASNQRSFLQRICCA